MFDLVSDVPADPILGLISAFRNDPNPQKVDLGVGVYRTEEGITPVLKCVKAAERQLVVTESTKTYIGSHGDPRFGEAISRLVFGPQSRVLAEQRVTATQTPGGTGALRIAMDFAAKALGRHDIWVPAPTWANHIPIANVTGLTVHRYPYVGSSNAMEFEALVRTLEHVPKGALVLLQVCCHNPTGLDLTTMQWQQVLSIVCARGLLPLMDFAYQGFGSGVEADAYPVREFADKVDGLIVTQSCSKNFGIYRERTGTLLVLAPNRQQMLSVRSYIAALARASYSNPPAHGGAVVTTVLESADLLAQWRGEVDAMRTRIGQMRQRLVVCARRVGLGHRFDFVADRRGMFCYMGLSREQVEQLRQRYGIYMVNNGRANIAGLTAKNVDYVCDAIMAVVQA